VSLVLLTVSTSSDEAFKLGIKNRIEEIRKKETKYLITKKSYSNSQSSGGGATRTSLFPLAAIGVTTPAASIVSINLAALL